MADADQARAYIERDVPDKEKLQPAFGIIPTHYFFAAVVGVLLLIFKWPLKWLISGAPLISYALIHAAAEDPASRVLPFIPLWTLLALINLTYAVAATSWLLYWLFLSACYPALFIVGLCQFNGVASVARKGLRSVLKGLQFTNNRIAFFDLPALEIDVDVEGLMCIRGLTFSFSSLTLVVHGVEVGIKLSADMELAIVTDEVVVKLFRTIEVGDVYANVKGGEYEMTFGKLAKRSKKAEGDALMVENTPLLAAAAAAGDTRRPVMPRMQTTSEALTNGKPPRASSIRSGFSGVRQMSADDKEADKQYAKLIKYIEDTSIIKTCINEAREALEDKDSAGLMDNDQDFRAAVCSQLHDKPSIAHPATKSIKVSTLQHLSPPHVRKFLHRLPLLLRLLLNPIAYFHPVVLKSITAGGSGRFLQSMLSEHVLPDGLDTGVKNLRQRISAWLTDANFVFEAVNLVASASVPINTFFNIDTHINLDDVMAYRTMPLEVDLKQIIRVGGADARITLPACLLPHHEHLLPPIPEENKEVDEKIDHLQNADGKPKVVQAAIELERTLKDEVAMNLSTHIHLPAAFDQSLLDFVSALVKATKIVEIEKDDVLAGGTGDDNDAESISEKSINGDKQHRGLREYARSLKSDMKDGIRRVAIDVAANDRWIAKVVGKVTKKLEVIQGDVGYSGAVPISLAAYRAQAETASKLMP